MKKNIRARLFEKKNILTNSTKTNFIVGAGLIAFPSVLVAVNVLAFSTVGKHPEHENITRAALGCGRAGVDNNSCFEPKSLDEIAGKKNFYGAVGLPDYPVYVNMGLKSKYHCDNGDWLSTKSYGNTKDKAEAKLLECRKHMLDKMKEATNDAANLLHRKTIPLIHKKDTIDNSQIPTVIKCDYNNSKGRAKCNVLESFGILLHAAQDFYSHSNWNDKEDSRYPIDLNNPPGLKNYGASPWLNLRNENPAFPEGLISGCFDVASVIDAEIGCANRVKHQNLNKDDETKPRSIVLNAGNSTADTNFNRAWQAARDDTRDKWKHLQEAIVAKYGSKNGNRMICAIRKDNPAKTCP